MAFSRLFTRYPLISNSVIYASTYVGAEFSQQFLLKKVLREPNTPEKPYDFEVLKRYGIVSMFGTSPTIYYWYKWLDGALTGRGMKVVVQKCLLDQFVIVPVLITLFYTGMSYLEGRPDLFEEARVKGPKTFVANASFWLPVQYVNFAMVPPKFRIVYIGACNFLWANILCLFKRGDIE